MTSDKFIFGRLVVYILILSIAYIAMWFLLRALNANDIMALLNTIYLMLSMVMCTYSVINRHEQKRED